MANPETLIDGRGPSEIHSGDRANRQEVGYLCDRCGWKMFEDKCKILCGNCGNRFDCSDLSLHFD